MDALFDNQPRVTSTDRKRLTPYLAGWTKLSPALKTMPVEDIQRCVLIEATGPRRKLILERLLARYNKSTRNRILQTISSNAPANPGT